MLLGIIVMIVALVHAVLFTLPCLVHQVKQLGGQHREVVGCVRACVRAVWLTRSNTSAASTERSSAEYSSAL